MKIQYTFQNDYRVSEMIDFLREKGVPLNDIDNIMKNHIFDTCEVELDTKTMQVKLISMNGVTKFVTK